MGFVLFKMFYREIIMKDLIIVGAGSAAREYLQFAKDINNASPKPRWHIKGFIADSGVDIKTLTNGEYDIIGTINDWQPSENEEFVCAVSEPHGKKLVVEKLLARGAVFPQFIHPSAEISDYVEIGQGVVMYPHTEIGPNAHIGDFVTIAGNVAHDCVVEKYASMTGLPSLTGYVHIGEMAFVGARAVITPHIKIGKEAFVCAGSVVIRNVRDKTKVLGNPAKRVQI